MCGPPAISEPEEGGNTFIHIILETYYIMWWGGSVEQLNPHQRAKWNPTAALYKEIPIRSHEVGDPILFGFFHRIGAVRPSLYILDLVSQTFIPESPRSIA